MHTHAHKHTRLHLHTHAYAPVYMCTRKHAHAQTAQKRMHMQANKQMLIDTGLLAVVARPQTFFQSVLLWLYAHCCMFSCPPSFASCSCAYMWVLTSTLPASHCLCMHNTCTHFQHLPYSCVRTVSAYTLTLSLYKCLCVSAMLAGPHVPVPACLKA